MTDQEKFINDAIRSSTGAWFESPHCKIFGKDRSKGVFTPRQNYLQRKIQRVINKMEDMELPVRIMGLKPRQKGSTTYFAAAVYCALRRKATAAVIIGGQFSQVDEAKGMLKTYQKHDTFNWGNTGEINIKGGTWSHGSKLIGETAKDLLAGVGSTTQVLHGFEVARWAQHGVANSAEVLANIVKTVPLLPDTMIILESTAEGAAGDFYERYFNAVDGDDFLSGVADVSPGSYVRIFAPWFEFSDSAMRLTEEQQEEVKNTLDSEEEYLGEKELIELYGVDDGGVLRLGTTVKDFSAYEQLYWRRWSIREECKRDKNTFDRDYPKDERSAFQKSGSQRFNTGQLARMRKNMVKCTPLHGVIEEDKRRVAFRQTSETESTVTVFEKPIPGCRYIAALDPMTGETQVGGMDPDWHSAFVLRAGYWDAAGKWKRMATAARIIPCRWEIDLIAEHLFRLARYYGPACGCKIVIEMNQDKGATELLKPLGADLYVREFWNQRENRPTKALGLQTNVKSRETLIESMATIIREWDKPGDGIDIWCPNAMDQFDNFVRKKNGRSEAAEGWKDDDVFSISMGAHLIGHATMYHAPQFIHGLPPEMRDTRIPQRPGAYS